MESYQKETRESTRSLASGLNRSFIYGFLILLCMSGDRRLVGRMVAKQWFLLFPSIATLTMFSMVWVEGRYIAPYPIVIGLVLFSSVAVVRSAFSLKLVYRTVLLAVAFFAASSTKPAAGELLSFARSLHKDEILGRGGPWHVSTEAVSDALKCAWASKWGQGCVHWRIRRFLLGEACRCAGECGDWTVGYELLALFASSRTQAFSERSAVCISIGPRLQS